MALNINPVPGAQGAPDRGQAIKQIIAARETAKVPPKAPEPEAPRASEPPPAAPAEKKPDPEYLIELERRERAMDQLKHEIALRDAEIERRKASEVDGKDWKRLLATHGHSVESIVQEWLAGEDASKAGATAAAPAPKAETKSEEAARLERIERRLAEEDAKRQREARLAEIRGMTPKESDDFEVTNAMDWHEMILNNLDQIAQREKRQLGPQETSKLIKDFETQSRSQLEKDLARLAKTKYGSNILKRLLAAESSPASEPNEAEPSNAYRESSGGTPERAVRLRLTGSELREEARKRVLSRWK